jgi:thiol-disulfide isomerase/thioredoxin
MKFFGSEKVAQNKRLIKELKEWGVLLVIGGIIYLGGWHTEVIGFAQRLLLSTHIIQPSLSPTPLKADKHSIGISGIDSMDSQDGLRADFDFSLNDSEDNAVSMRAFEGKTIFINFWATWCPPCIAEMPNIQGLYSDLKKDDSIVFMMISLDQDPQKALEFLVRKNYDLPVYFPRSPKPRVYDTSVVPTTYVIDKKGFIIMKKRGMAQYNTQRFKDFLQAEPNEGIDVDL